VYESTDSSVAEKACFSALAKMLDLQSSGGRGLAGLSEVYRTMGPSWIGGGSTAHRKGMASNSAATWQ
jgi:hypothetical protein